MVGCDDGGLGEEEDDDSSIFSVEQKRFLYKLVSSAIAVDFFSFCLSSALSNDGSSNCMKQSFLQQE